MTDDFTRQPQFNADGRRKGRLLCHHSQLEVNQRQSVLLYLFSRRKTATTVESDCDWINIVLYSILLDYLGEADQAFH